ncbi:hypothetical protein, partial [Herbaspirillum sp. B65]|uniref:hypothetical protein n=1 Tax=Herbaspirillum sp. B65 TaxID=137708 RepID=UPI001C25FEFE
TATCFLVHVHLVLSFHMDGIAVFRTGVVTRLHRSDGDEKIKRRGPPDSSNQAKLLAVTRHFESRYFPRPP